MAFSYPIQRMKFMLPIDGTSTLTSGLQAHDQLLEISLLSHTTATSRYVTLSDRMTHQEGTHPADSNSYLTAGSRIGCPLLMCSLEHCWYRQSEKQTMGHRHLKEVQTLWNRLPLKKKCIYEAIVHVDLNITTSHRKCLTLNPPFLSTSESLKFKRLS